MMLLRIVRPAVSMLILSAILCCGPSDEDVLSDGQTCYVYRLTVAESTEPRQAIIATIDVSVDNCYQFETVERYRVGRKWVLLPIEHRSVTESDSCASGSRELRTSLSLKAPDTGWVYIEVQSKRRVVLDSTYVHSRPFLTGRFKFTGYDSLGATVMSGQLSMSSPEPSCVSGEWQMVVSWDRPRTVPLTLDGHLAGWFTNGRLDVDLQPPVEGGLRLTGSIHDDQYAGEWFLWASRTIDHGTFKAERLPECSR